MEKCLICKMKTSNIPKDITSETYVCTVCEGKYGNKLFNKLKELDIKFTTFSDNDNKIKPFTAKVSYEGGTKEDIAQMVCSIIENAEIWDEVKSQMRWFGS